MDRKLNIKVAAGQFIKTLGIDIKGQRMWLTFGYNKPLIAAIKQMESAKWHGFEDPPIKKWSIANSNRNWFRLNYLQWRAFPKAYKLANPHKNPYAVYNTPLTQIKTERSLYDHQREMCAHILTRKQCVFACEMGTGKTLAAIEAAEQAGMTNQDVWYVGPVSGVKAVKLELVKWNSKISWRMMTYNKLVTVMKNWDGSAAPKMVIFDESSKLKNKTAQRSQAALYLANAIREEHGADGYVVEMTGTPSPKAPTDWWHQCEVACPGFLLEPNPGRMKTRMCKVEMRPSITGGEYPHIVAWFDNEKRCLTCGLEHDGSEEHDYVPSVNEVALLHKRMDGLVLVKFSKDCLDLPELLFETVRIKPNVETLRAARLILKTSPRAITGLTLCRELSDGFQYTEEKIGMTQCTLCNGTGDIEAQMPVEAYDIDNPVPTGDLGEFKTSKEQCFNCGGKGEVPVYKRGLDSVHSPKDDYLIEELDAHSDDGRYLVWGGFTGTIDKLINIIKQQGWVVLSVDGRGYRGFHPNSSEQLDPDELLVAMDTSHPRYEELRVKYPKLCFVGHPKAGGMALTLTASRTSLFYSNDYDGEARMQAVKRGHRAGMLNRAHTIKDLVHLETDQLVLDNLNKKVRMQNITLGDLTSCLSGKV